MRWTWVKEWGAWAIGFRTRSWALPLLITWTPDLFEIAIGPIFLAREEKKEMPF